MWCDTAYTSSKTERERATKNSNQQPAHISSTIHMHIVWMLYTRLQHVWTRRVWQTPQVVACEYRPNGPSKERKPPATVWCDHGVGVGNGGGGGGDGDVV
jgi:hypothetical protein